MNRWQWILSGIIVFYLGLVVIIPNSHSYFHNSLKSWLWPLANSLNIGYTWQFFSPDPVATIYYTYDAFKDNILLASKDIPRGKGGFLFRFNYTRRLALKNISSKYPELVYSVYVPYYCRQFPEANYIKITQNIAKPVSLEEAQQGKKSRDLTKVYKEDLGYEGCKQ